MARILAQQRAELAALKNQYAYNPDPNWRLLQLNPKFKDRRQDLLPEIKNKPKPKSKTAPKKIRTPGIHLATRKSRYWRQRRQTSQPRVESARPWVMMKENHAP